MRTPYVAGNWKMNLTREEARVLALGVVAETRDASARVMVAPPFTAIEAVASVVQGSRVELGAQNMGPDVSGAYTGEVSPAMLRDVGVTTVILGHSERRHTFGENDDLINKKVKLALEQELSVILCVGETLDEREAGRVDEVVAAQLLGGLADIESAAMSRITIAYEPVWAIGTGKTATPDDAQAVHATIRRRLSQRFDDVVADSTIIQYGGSVKPDNAASLMGQPDIDGALVGGASLKADAFGAIAVASKNG